MTSLDKQQITNQVCRICGCTDHTICVHPVKGACWWVEDDLCSHCEKWPDESEGPVKLKVDEKEN